MAAFPFGPGGGQVQVLSPSVDVSQIEVVPLTCDVTAANVLKCVSCGATRTRKIFRVITDRSAYQADILAFDDQVARDGWDELEFGVFTGADCVMP